MKICKGMIYLLVGVMLDLSGVALCIFVIYSYARFGAGDALGDARIFVIAGSGLFLIVVLPLLIWEIPRLGKFILGEDGSIQFSYLIPREKTGMARVFNVKRFWLKSDSRFKIKYLDSNNTFRTIIVVTRRRYYNSQTVLNLLSRETEGGEIRSSQTT